MWWISRILLYEEVLKGCIMNTSNIAALHKNPSQNHTVVSTARRWSISKFRAYVLPLYKLTSSQTIPQDTACSLQDLWHYHHNNPSAKTGSSSPFLSITINDAHLISFYRHNIGTTTSNGEYKHKQFLGEVGRKLKSRTIPPAFRSHFTSRDTL